MTIRKARQQAAFMLANKHKLQDLFGDIPQQQAPHAPQIAQNGPQCSTDRRTTKALPEADNAPVATLEPCRV